jgi:2-phospho-L-lactate guanylyltransferase (CobY/MobA/RfbA family)
MAEANVKEAKTLLQKILGEDYDEERMKKMIDHVITALEPDSVVL